MGKIVITGSSGRIGRALHWKLSRNHEVIGIDLSVCSATSHIQDIRDLDGLKKCFEGVETLYHAAAFHAPHVGVISEQLFHDVNVKATENICKAALASGVRQIVFTSTTALYGYANTAEETTVWVNEVTKPEPRTIYHTTKLEAEAVLQTYSGKDLTVSVMRMSRCFPEPANQMAVYRLHRGVDYRDVADAHILAAELDVKKDFDVYVISGFTPFQRSDCHALFNEPEPVIRERHPELAAEFDRRHWNFPKRIDRVYDASYAEKVLGWRARLGAMAVLDQYDNSDYEILHPE